MTTDVKQSLIAVASVAGLFAFLWISLALLDEVYLPDWVLPLGLILMTMNFAWRFVAWLRAMRARDADQ